MSEAAILAKNAAVTAIANAAKYISIHTVDPAGTGAGELTNVGPYNRVATTWGVAAGGSITGSLVTVLMNTGVTIVGWGVWDAPTGGNFWEGGLLPVSETFNGAGGVFNFTPTLTATG